MSARAPRTSARLLAPLALALCAFAVLIVFATSLGGGSSDGATTAETAADRTPTATTTTPKERKPASYTVQPGDTLGGISEETGVAVEDLELLNPELDPQALIAGQKIKLRE